MAIGLVSMTIRRSADRRGAAGRVKRALAHVVRYFPEYALARDAVQRGEIGTPSMLRATRGGSFPTVSSGWYTDSARSGGVALDLMFHDFEWTCWRSCSRPIARPNFTRQSRCHWFSHRYLRPHSIN